ncbi:Dynein light chain Tctex-type 1 [Labeo rohita]|uniref:Dynein light chain Tctex-type 1 n=1 Tax=Labeo rohita TaxID=84645 RepID=A0ABQ8MS74_LABRO|nr:Dynein light chain Tctex-type 1 [Labeo rohita]
MCRVSKGLSLATSSGRSERRVRHFHDNRWGSERRQRRNMDDDQSAEETAFVVDEVSSIVKESLEAVIGRNPYEHKRVNQWTSSVVEQCLGQIITCIIMQKNGAGLQSASSCFWDNTTDGSCTVRWENKHLYCIVSVFGLAI